MNNVHSLLNKSAREVKRLIKMKSRVVVFTGAGISTESGVSDYRSQGGIWDRYQPVTYQEFLDDENKRKEYWKRKKDMYGQIQQSKPNKGHMAIARLEQQGKLLGVITQNIDGLHQIAGNKRVLELHGTNREAICLECQKKSSFDLIYERLLKSEEIPLCDCGGLLKPNTISFGQHLIPEVLDQAFSWAENCDLMLALGSSLVVEPAASLPSLAKHRGAALVIINREPTPLDDLADIIIHSEVGPVMDSVVD